MQNTSTDERVSASTDSDVENPPDVKLCSLIAGYARDWRQNRFGTFQDYRGYYNDREGVTEEGDTAGVGMAQATKGKGIHTLSTLTKVRSGAAKVSDAHHTNARYPYDIKTDHPNLEPYRLTMRKVQDRCLDEQKFWEVLDTTVYSGATYGTMLMVGPLPYTQDFSVVTGEPEITLDRIHVPREEFKAKLPRAHYVHPMDAAPDPRSKTAQDGVGFTWRQTYQPEDLEAMRDDESYRYIDYVLTCSETQDDDQYASEKLKENRRNVLHYEKDGLIVGYHFYGLVPVEAYIEWLHPDQRDKVDFNIDDPLNRRIEVCALLLGGVVVKCSLNSYPGARRPIAKGVWGRRDDEFDGRSVAEDNKTFSKIKNAAVRLYFQSKTLSLLRPKLMNPAMFLPNQEFEVKPGAVWRVQPWVMTQEQSRAAYREIDITDVSSNWLEPYDLVDRLSDEGTAIPKWAEGSQTSAGANPTATGISLIMGASYLPLKQVMENIDMMLSDYLDAQIKWTVKYLDAKVVESWFGKEDADRWRTIQQTGETAWFKFRAVGTENFLKKQVLFQKLMVIYNLAMSNPEVAKVVDWVKFFTIIFECADLGMAPPLKTEAQIQQVTEDAMKAQAAQQQHEKTLKAADAQTKLSIAETKAQADLMKAEGLLELEEKRLDKESQESSAAAA